MKRNIIAIDNNQLLASANEIKELSLNNFDSMFLIDIVDGTKIKVLPIHLVSNFTLKNPNYRSITSMSKDKTDIKEIINTLDFCITKYCSDNPIKKS